MQKMDVVVVGSCMTDLVSTVPRLPVLGETLHGNTFYMGFGGKGANQCIVAGRLGAKTAMVAKVGDDSFGKNYLQNFRDNNINIDHVGVTEAASTGVATISVTEKGDNAIVIVAGANLLLNGNDLLEAEKLFSQAKVVVCQLETRPETSLSALKLAKKYNVTTIFNPAPAVTKLDPEFYKYCDIICPNESEAELLTGQKVSSVEDADRVATELMSRGCKTVIITMGKQGAVFRTQDADASVRVPCQPVQPVDTTGAGDAFVGALAFYLATQPSLGLKESIRRASEIATVSVQAAGTQTSFPYKKDLPDALFT